MENPDYHPNYARIEKAIAYLTDNVIRQPELDEVAEVVALSPFHLQRIFTEWAGISPKRFLQYLTTGYLKRRLFECGNLMEAADLVGLSSQSRVYDLFVNLEAVTPQEYKLGGEGIRIEYGVHPTPFGNCLIGVTERGICRMTFYDYSPDKAIQELRTDWPLATISENPTATEPVSHKIFNPVNQPGRKLNVLVKGTNFQVKVWEALLALPDGHLTTYGDIARRIGNPKAMQAVGSAVGANPVAWLIPCHRVIRKEGVLGEYRWGATRKKAMIGWEQARAEAVRV
jgi:AraC family transcriptional regulator of adaptative response/methylated-DNA-[protein]-cysteine methyltransferase